jgi:hypothetical protein
MARKKPKDDPQRELRRERAAIAKEKHEGPFMRLFASRHPDLPVPVRDYVFAPPRKFKFDFAWKGMAFPLAVELHGGGGRGRHTSVTGHKNDCDKMNIAIGVMGWRVLQYNVVHLKDMVSVVDMVAHVVREARDGVGSGSPGDEGSPWRDILLSKKSAKRKKAG